MKKLFLVLIMGSLMVVGCGMRRASSNSPADSSPAEQQQAAVDNKQEVATRMQEAGTVLEQLMDAPDDAIPEFVLQDAKCVAVVPSMVKGGFIFGAQHGRGVATCRTDSGWSAPAFFTVTGGNWGAQIGAQAVDLVMVVMNEEGMRNLLNANWTLAGEASAAAGPVGRQAKAETDWKMKAQVLTYSRARGLYAGMTLNGANIRPDVDSTVAFYGKPTPFNQILTGEIQAPKAASTFLASVRQNFREANARYDNQ